MASSPTIGFRLGLLATKGSAIDAEEHSHNAIQIIWPAPQHSFLFNLQDGKQQELNHALIVPANKAHSLTMKLGWIVLIEPQSQLGEAISASLQDESLKLLELGDFPNNVEELVASLALVFGVSAIAENHLDQRIKNLLSNLDQCFIDECLKPAHWKAQEVAQQLNLSESRFLHLFKQEMHIPWRPYLLWRRLLCAVSVLITGRSATEAAHVAGFSDSAHLSRTFKKMFGISIRQAQKTLLK